VKRVKLIWLAALAAFALTAVAVTAGSASAAEPEWGHCVSVKSKGHFEDANCTKEDFKENKKHEKKYKGKFEWDSGAAAACYPAKKGHYEDSACTKEDFKENTKTHEKKYKGKYEKTGGPKFTGEGGAGVLDTEYYQCESKQGEEEVKYIQAPREDCNWNGTRNNEQGYSTSSDATVECQSEQASGEAVGTDEVADVAVRFKGCSAFGEPATSPGLPAGEIETNTLKGRLGYINKSSHEVGVLLEPTAGGLFAEFSVLGGVAMVGVGVGNATEGAFWEETSAGVPNGHDGIISPVTPIDQMTHTFTQVYKGEELAPPCQGVGAAHCENPKLIHAKQNVPTSFEGGQRESLEDYLAVPESEFEYAWSSADQEITNVNTVEGEAEIKG